MNFKIKSTYKGPKTESIVLESDWTSQDALEKIIDDMINTGRFFEIMVVDELGTEWTRKEFSKLKEKIDKEPHNIFLFFDGGYDLESGAAGIGMVIYYTKGGQQFRVRANSKLEELDSNNEAEYAALYNAMDLLEDLGVHHIPCTIKGDSQGVLKQLSGEWPCFEKNLNRWLDRIEAKIQKLGIKPTYESISRKENKEADQLASQALNNKLINSHSEIVN